MKHYSDHAFDFSDDPSTSVLMTTYHPLSGNFAIFSPVDPGPSVTIRLNQRQLASLITDLSTLLAKHGSS